MQNLQAEYSKVYAEVYADQNDLEYLKRRALQNLKRIQEKYQKNKFNVVNHRFINRLNQDDIPRFARKELLVESTRYYQQFTQSIQEVRKMQIRKFETISSNDKMYQSGQTPVCRNMYASIGHSPMFQDNQVSRQRLRTNSEHYFGSPSNGGSNNQSQVMGGMLVSASKFANMKGSRYSSSQDESSE